MKDFNLIRIKEMTKEFGDKVAVHEFNLELAKGEFVTFLGPSGCGKSTALNCITGLIPITNGEIYIDEECIDNSKSKISPEKRGFGMVFQNYALFPHLSVHKNVAFGLQLKKLPKKTIEEKVEAALKLVHLEGYGDKFPSQMSGGEQQRVAIARCIVLEPRLLLLDEPLSNLDAKLRIELRYELKALHERLHVTTIYVTHDQGEALALSDRIVVMKKGHIQQIGTPAEIYSNPINLFVADFMGFKNIWPAKIESLKESGEALEAVVAVADAKLRANLRYGKDDPRREALKKAFAAGAEVRTAIRPEDLSTDLAEGQSRVRCTTILVEYQGQSSQVSAEMGNGFRVDLRAQCDIQSGKTIELGIDPDKIFILPALEASPS